jgi:hypothetical protein
VLVPTAAIGTVADLALQDALGKGKIALAILALATVAVAGLGYYFLKGVLAHVVVHRREGREPPRAWQLLPRLPYATMIAVDLSLATAVGAGLELFVVPGLLIGAYFALAPILVEVEDRGYIGSFRRSGSLVHGHFWLVAAVLFVTIAGTALLSLPIRELAAVILPGDATDWFEEGLGLLLAGIIVKPIGAVITIELTLDLIEQNPA